MNLGYTNCSAPGWSAYSPSCLGCEFDARDAGFSAAVGRLWTNFAASGNPNQRKREAPTHTKDTETAATTKDEWGGFAAPTNTKEMEPSATTKDEWGGFAAGGKSNQWGREAPTNSKETDTTATTTHS